MSLLSQYVRVLQEAFGRDDEGESFVHPEGDEHLVARGDMMLDEGEESALKSELPGVGDSEWTQFCRALICAKPSEVSPSNGLGMFSQTPRRLADLGMVKKLARTKSPSNRTIWVAVFVAPMTCSKFLSSPSKQYETFSRSTKNYADKIASGEIEKDPSMSLSGALAVLHRAGPSGLKTWESGERFEGTVSAFERVNGLF